MSVSIKDVRKGTMVILRNGWEARIEDNGRGHTRLATVFGVYTEMGSVYTTDIVTAQMPDGSYQVVEHTPAQLKARQTRSYAGF
jgi:hypothetical protein